MNTTTRAALESAACQGMTDEDLAARGPSGFAAMIMRKRHYAAAARKLAATVLSMTTELITAQKEIAKLRAERDAILAKYEADAFKEEPASDAGMPEAEAAIKAAMKGGK